MLSFEQNLKLIAELAKRALNTLGASDSNGVKHVSQAIEEIANAVREIERRVQSLEGRTFPAKE